MARLLFDIFYDGDCVSEDGFQGWLQHPDPSETDGMIIKLTADTFIVDLTYVLFHFEGHSVVEMSTKDFFVWLAQIEPEGEEEDN
jgi:hypothetical protein